MRKRVLGEEHPDTLTSMANLALTYLDQGQWTEAEQLSVQVLEARMRILGKEHPDTQESVTNLVSNRNQGQKSGMVEGGRAAGFQVSETRERALDLNEAIVSLDIPEQAPEPLSYSIDLVGVTNSPDISERAPDPLSYSIDLAEVTDSPDIPEQAPEPPLFFIDLAEVTDSSDNSPFDVNVMEEINNSQDPHSFSIDLEENGETKCSLYPRIYCEQYMSALQYPL